MMETTWFTLAEAASKFGLEEELIMTWVTEGVVRTDGVGEALRVNADDIDLKVQEMTGV